MNATGTLTDDRAVEFLIPSRAQILRRRINVLTAFFIIALIISGATAIPLLSEVDWLVSLTKARQIIEAAGPSGAPSWALWVIKVQNGLQQVATTQPFLFYGTDWLAFGHFVIAVAFIGALRDPVRNAWLFTFGIIACVLVIPYALLFGGIRGIPLYWRLIDCSFGIFGFPPLWLCRKWSRELESWNRNASKATSDQLPIGCS